MKNVLVTGSKGFIGRNLMYALRRQQGLLIQEFDVDSPPSSLDGYLAQADVVFHVAGVNRPDNEEGFFTGNSSLTSEIVNTLLKGKNRPLLVLTSSMQAQLDNPYGRSKLMSEQSIKMYSDSGGKGVIFRLPNVFGKWSRPNYNSAVATFCYNIARDLPIYVSDSNRVMELSHIDDVVRKFISLLEYSPSENFLMDEVQPIFRITLGDLVEEIRAFKAMRTGLTVPDLSNHLRKALFATYSSFLPDTDLKYNLAKRTDERGCLAELLKSPHFGQIFLSRTKPGVTRGNHWHDFKVEKFCVLEGDAIIRLRHVERSDVVSYPVRGDEFQVVDIPPGYTHSIENVGMTELVVLFWASEEFNHSRPDTVGSLVSQTKE